MYSYEQNERVTPPLKGSFSLIHPIFKPTDYNGQKVEREISAHNCLSSQKHSNFRFWIHVTL